MLNLEEACVCLVTGLLVVCGWLFVFYGYDFKEKHFEVVTTFPHANILTIFVSQTSMVLPERNDQTVVKMVAVSKLLLNFQPYLEK